MRKYTQYQVRQAQAIGDGNMDQFEVSELSKQYIKTTVLMSRLNLFDYPQDLSATTWLEYRAREVFVDGKPFQDLEGMKTVLRLIKMYNKGVEFRPIVVDSNYYILDGVHRYAALNSLSVRLVEIFYPAV